MKKIIFFDGDGTLWYPKAYRHTKPPFLIYRDPKNPEGHRNPHNKHFMLIPGTIPALKKLKAKGVIFVLLSMHPHPPKEADALVKKKVKHFRLKELFDEVYAPQAPKTYAPSPTKEKPSPPGELGIKAKFTLRILKKRKLPKSQALMVGDSINHDYRPARAAGIDAVLIDTPYIKEHPLYKKVKWKKIRKLKELLKYV